MLLLPESNWNILDSHYHTKILSEWNLVNGLIELRSPFASGSCISGKPPELVAVCLDAAGLHPYTQDSLPFGTGTLRDTNAEAIAAAGGSEMYEVGGLVLGSARWKFLLSVYI
jgi:hypothetical protein